MMNVERTWSLVHLFMNGKSEIMISVLSHDVVSYFEYSLVLKNN